VWGGALDLTITFDDPSLLVIFVSCAPCTFLGGSQGGPRLAPPIFVEHSDIEHASIWFLAVFASVSWKLAQ
jgi:hypothetical protein